MTHKLFRQLVLLCALTPGVTLANAATRQDLAAAVTKSKLSLADGVRQATTDGGVAISAKFEFDDSGKLSLSVYSAKKGLAIAAEDNILEEIAGSPEQIPWKTEVEVFKDAPHVARSSEQLTLLTLSRLTLLDVIGKAQANHQGTVFSITPQIKQHAPVAVVLIAKDGKVTKLTYKLSDGALVETSQQ